MADLSLKAGASLLLGLAFNDSTGAPMDLTGCTVTSQVRDVLNVLVMTLPVVVTTPANGQATIEVLDTSAWPIGTLRCDVKCASGSETLYSETFGILVQKAVTQ